jgi:FkbM family methyltransferase
MKRMLVRKAQQILAQTGFELRRVRHGYNMLSAVPGGAPKAILDIGANSGQFARKVRSVLPDCVIHSFEPLSGPFAELKSWAGRSSDIHCHNIALGDQAGKALIHTGSYTPASSLMSAAKKLKRSMPHVVPDCEQEIEVATLDDWFERQDIPRPFVVKMDVQGYEMKVIAGGKNAIAQAAAVLTELSFLELYEGQPLAIDLLLALRECGFEMADIYDVSRDPGSSFGFQFDALFFPKRFLRG